MDICSMILNSILLFNWFTITAKHIHMGGFQVPLKSFTPFCVCYFLKNFNFLVCCQANFPMTASFGIFSAICDSIAIKQWLDRRPSLLRFLLCAFSRFHGEKLTFRRSSGQRDWNKRMTWVKGDRGKTGAKTSIKYFYRFRASEKLIEEQKFKLRLYLTKFEHFTVLWGMQMPREGTQSYIPRSSKHLQETAIATRTRTWSENPGFMPLKWSLLCAK